MLLHQVQHQVSQQTTMGWGVMRLSHRPHPHAANTTTVVLLLLLSVHSCAITHSHLDVSTTPPSAFVRDTACMNFLKRLLLQGTKLRPGLAVGAAGLGAAPAGPTPALPPLLLPLPLLLLLPMFL